MADRAAHLTGERLPVWVPLAMAIAGLIGSVATAELAVADDDTQATPTPAPTLQATQASEASATTSLPSPDDEPSGANDSSGRVEDRSAREPAAGGDGSSEPANTDLGVDCPPLFVVFFPFGSATPLSSPGSKPDELASWMATHPEARLVVDGHADAAGTEEANLALSFRRAEAAAALLTGAGIEAGRIQARGFGEYQPVVGAPVDSEQNRRVTVQLEGRSDCPLDDKDTSE